MRRTGLFESLRESEKVFQQIPFEKVKKNIDTGFSATSRRKKWDRLFFAGVLGERLSCTFYCTLNICPAWAKERRVLVQEVEADLSTVGEKKKKRERE